MDQGRKVSGFARGMIGLLLGAALPQLAFAGGGETEVVKTSPSNPPPVISVPAPVTPVQADPPAAAPPVVAPPPVAAAKPASPVGGSGGAGWAAKTAQPRRPQTPAPAPVPVKVSDEEILGKVNDYFNKLANLEGDFVQTEPDNTQKHGKFYFARPGRLRFDYALPSRLKIIANGYYLAIEDYALNTSDKYPLEMTPFRLLLSETVDLARDANIYGIEQGADTIVVTVEDKKGDAAGRISLFFSKPDISLKQWIITDAQGLNTRIEVSNLEQNKRVSAELFEFSKDVGFHRE